MTLTGKSLGEAATFWFTREPLHSIAHVQETIIEFKHFSPFKEKLTVFIFPDHDIESLFFFNIFFLHTVPCTLKVHLSHLGCC